MGTGATPPNLEDLAIIQQGPKAWNEWRGKNKQRASFNLSGADLHGRDLTGADLRAVDLSNANLREAKLGAGTLLWNANLSGSDLYQTNLRGADLQDVNFSNADLYQADLRESNLKGADLSTAKGGLFSRQLAGSDLTGAKLPDPLKNLYDSLSSVKEISDSAQKLFLALLAGCLYSWLTIAQTTDVELITNRATTPLPIIQAAIPIVGFYVVAPLILLCLYFYFHFYLQKLWEELGSLPAVFTDGRELHKCTDPWLLNDLVRSHFVMLKNGRPFLSYLQSWISVVLAWWVVPIALFAFWLRFLRRHDLFWTIVHALQLALGVFAAVRLYQIANRTLRGYERPSFRWRDWLKDRSSYGRTSFAVAVAVLAVAMSLGAIYGDPYWIQGNSRMQLRISSPRTWMPWLLNRAGFHPFADLRNADVSIKPANWTGKKDEELDLVKGASLQGSGLWNANANGSFFVKTDLTGAFMEGINLGEADLRQATLDDAQMQGAILYAALLQNANVRGTDLRGAFLPGAHLDHAHMDSANLERAVLSGANFSGADLHGANLRHATLSEANLKAADLSSADLQNAGPTGANLTQARLFDANVKYANFRSLEPLSATRGLTPEMITAAKNWQLAFYDSDMLKQLGLPPDHNEKLQKQMDAELKQAKTGEAKSAKQE